MTECIIFVSETELSMAQKMSDLKNHIYHLEELAANAWPARVTQTVNGWRLRYTDGVTRRANSVWPNLRAPHSSQTHADLDEQLATVENFYAKHNLPSRFQICPAAQPADLAQQLTNRGYTNDATTNVQTASIATILAKLNQEKIEEDLGIKATINQHITHAWFESYCQSESVVGNAIDVRRGIMQRIAPVTGFAHISGSHHLAQDNLAQHNRSQDDTPAALGLGVVERGWLGIFCMTTKPEYRRKGYAKALLHALVKWAHEQGASNAYLQVMEVNTPATKLYQRLGFETVYQYYYATKKAP